ncbi:binding--dependent transport system inner membrane component family protein [Lyngbya aestuarii BL J]|uniref:Binding--dependent transport system inner membrane component family protein n=1 Tax=Lyngbya aestuarii BL J TaxID=1348334 RepID=U7QB20_9CYAN|nr:ABC transporter permease subunit [Lyngbya aestuarii]ERT04245.1 binding--dependent transport system inner membrane component family protein [Lyngbya aestuarii BL J]
MIKLPQIKPGTYWLWIQATLALAFLYLPILILVIYSFNTSRFNAIWTGFTLDWYWSLFGKTTEITANFSTVEIWQALNNSLIIAVISTGIATILGTTVALALERFRFPGDQIIAGLILLPIIIPEITLAISLLVFFTLIFRILENLTGIRLTLGLPSVILGHITFNIAFVMITVRARLAELDPALEEAALDLGANEWRTFTRITFPLILPGIVSGALLAFTLSLDDFVVTFFNTGVGATTLPLFVYGMIKLSVTPAINALSTLMLFASLLLVLSSLTINRTQPTTKP